MRKKRNWGWKLGKRKKKWKRDGDQKRKRKEWTIHKIKKKSLIKIIYKKRKLNNFEGVH